MARRLGLGAFRVETRRGGHVEALRGPNAFRVVHQHEGRGPVAGTFDAGRPVRLVAEHEVEGRRAFVLRAPHDVERVVGAEDHGHGVLSRLAQCPGNRRRVCGDGELELLERGVLVVAPGAGIGADADIAVRDRALRRPLPHRLLKQRDRRHHIQHPAVDTGNGLRDAQRGEGLARPARHDQLAVVMGLEAGGHVVVCGLLMGPEAERFAPEGQVFGLTVDRIRPVEGSAREVGEAQHGARRLQRNDGLAGVGAPRVAGVDHDARGERIARRGGDERIEMGFRNLRSGRVALALDGAVAALAFFRDQVDADVSGIEVLPEGGPFGPQPDIGEPFRVEGILDEISLHQPLEEASLLRFGAGDGPDVVQRSSKAIVQCCFSREAFRIHAGLSVSDRWVQSCPGIVSEHDRPDR